MSIQVARRAVAHIRFDGRSRDIQLDALGVNADAGDREIRQAVARALELPEGRLQDSVIDRHENGNLTVRPEAVFG